MFLYFQRRRNLQVKVFISGIYAKVRRWRRSDQLARKIVRTAEHTQFLDAEETIEKISKADITVHHLNMISTLLEAQSRFAEYSDEYQAISNFCYMQATILQERKRCENSFLS